MEREKTCAEWVLKNSDVSWSGTRGERSHTWRRTPVIPAPRRQREQDCGKVLSVLTSLQSDFQAGQGHTAKVCLKERKKNEGSTGIPSATFLSL